MKSPSIVFLTVVAAISVAAEKLPDSLYPQWFGSRERAETYAHGLFAGGDVEILRVADKDVLVLYVHGSGVPIIGIAVYRFSDGLWKLAARFRPVTTEDHKAIVAGKEVVVVGEKTKQRWPLLKLD